MSKKVSSKARKNGKVAMPASVREFFVKCGRLGGLAGKRADKVRAGAQSWKNRKPKKAATR